MNLKNLAYTSVGLIMFLGWIMNIFKLFGSISEPLTLLIFMRFIGIVFFPFGSILGFF